MSTLDIGINLSNSWILQKQKETNNLSRLLTLNEPIHLFPLSVAVPSIHYVSLGSFVAVLAYRTATHG